MVLFTRHPLPIVVVVGFLPDDEAGLAGRALAGVDQENALVSVLSATLHFIFHAR
jgi:hypothetical protein